MLNRRHLLLSSALAALAPSIAFAKPNTAGNGRKLNAVFDKIVQQQLQRWPETATSLGLDKGDLSGLSSRLTQMSLAAFASLAAEVSGQLKELRGINRATLGSFDAASYDTVLFTLDVTDEGNRSFGYGGGGVGAPYILSQLTGAYQSVPDFLDHQHRVDSPQDAEAYLARLDAFADVMDQELEVARHDAARGVTPPDFVIDKALIQMKTFLDTPAEQAVIVQSIARRAKEKNIVGDYGTRAADIYTGRVLPALGRQAAYLKGIRARAVHDAGVRRLPNGEAYYHLSLKSYTTATLSPKEIHQTGLDLVAELSSDIDRLLTKQGLAAGTVGQRLAAMTTDPMFLYANTDAAKEQLIADLNTKVMAVQAKLPAYFGTLPKAKVEIRRVPKAIEAGAPGGYYQQGSLDGTRPGAYYINLRDTAEVPRWGLPTLTFHESVPGHHVQLTLANEMSGLPLIRKMVWFSGYGEGWALYAEQLAAEMGMYDDDPFGLIGQRQQAMFRAVRLVVDTGMHAMGWSRERAIDYFVDHLGDKRSAATTEIERYCVWPGQACSYMVGKLTWLKLRERARKALGRRFDIRKFHDAGLLSGALPLAVLERVVGEYISTSKG